MPAPSERQPSLHSAIKQQTTQHLNPQLARYGYAPARLHKNTFSPFIRYFFVFIT